MKKVFRIQVTHSKGRRCFYIEGNASPCLLCITCEYGIGGYRGPPAGVNWGLLDSGSEAGMTEEKSAGMTHL